MLPDHCTTERDGATVRLCVLCSGMTSVILSADLSLSLSLYIYITYVIDLPVCVYTYVCVYIYIYIHTYTYICLSADRPPHADPCPTPPGATDSTAGNHMNWKTWQNTADCRRNVSNWRHLQPAAMPTIHRNCTQTEQQQVICRTQIWPRHA